MDERAMMDLVDRAIRNARAAWTEAHRGMPSNPMTRTAAIPAIGTLAAAILTRLPADDDEIVEETTKAISIARQAWQRSGADTPSNPMARTAEKAAIGIVAAGIINHPSARPDSETDAERPCVTEPR